jgi:flotillin
VDNVVKIQKAAAISRAESERDIKIAQARANKESNDAQITSETEIAQRKNELDIKKSELQKEADTKRAEADAAYEIQKQEQRKAIDVASTNADIAKQEREVELKEREADVREKALDAEIKKQADADKYRRTQEAEAARIERQNEADARKYEQEREAEAAKLQAEAAMYVKQKEAEGIAAVGRAEAEAIQAKGIAEAESMEKKAEAYAKYNNAAVTEMIIKQLPDIAKAIAEPISAIDKVTVIDSGNGESGVSAVGGYTPAVLAKVIESVKETTGFDLTETMKASTYDAKVNRNVNLNGMEIKLPNKDISVTGYEGRTESDPVSSDEELK